MLGRGRLPAGAADVWLLLLLSLLSSSLSLGVLKVSLPRMPSSPTRESEKEIDDMFPVTMSRRTVKFHKCSASGWCGGGGSGSGSGCGSGSGSGCGISCILLLSSPIGPSRRPGNRRAGGGWAERASPRAAVAKRKVVGIEACIVVDTAVTDASVVVRVKKWGTRKERKNYHVETR